MLLFHVGFDSPTRHLQLLAISAPGWRICQYANSKTSFMQN